MRISLLIVFLFACLSASPLTAQHSLDTIQVSSLQIPLKLSETGRNITVLTAEQIQALPATSLDEVLQTVTGLEVQSRGGFGVQGDILLRGSTFSQVLLLVDGMRLNDPLTGHFNSYIPVTPAEIARIEILRGAAAAMYGADAVGGVINVITKLLKMQAKEQVLAERSTTEITNWLMGIRDFLSRKALQVLAVVSL